MASPKEVKNNEVPTRRATYKLIWSLDKFSPPLLSTSAENISDAPFPNARSVTPATDSEHENLFDIASKDGDKWWSAII